MSNLEIITPTSDFPDPDLEETFARLNLRPLREKVRDQEGVPGLAYETTDGSTFVRYLQEPDLEIPVIVVDGDHARSLAASLRAAIPHFPELAASLSFERGASVTVKVTLLRILAAHALAHVTPGMTRAVALAASDPSPFVRLGAAQVFQYAQTPEIAEVVRRALFQDADPDVRGFAHETLAHFDESQKND